MPEPVSATIGICYIAGYTVLTAYARGGTAISAEARAARHVANAIVESVERSQALFGKKAAAISQLRALANENAVQAGNGNQVPLLDPLAILITENFVRALPEGIPLPDFAVDPDRSVSLDWIESRNRMFSMSIGTNHRLAYAWLDGADKGHGVANFDGERVPSMVLEGIRGVMSHGNTTIWPT